MQRLRREIKAWKEVDHENILKVLGTVHDAGPMVSIVYPWADLGTLTKYLKVQAAEITVSRRFEIVSHFKDKLGYFHSSKLVTYIASGCGIWPCIS